MALVTITQEDKTIIHSVLWFNQNDFLKIMNLNELNQVHHEIINQFMETLRN